MRSSIYKEHWDEAMDYRSYRAKIDDLLSHEKTTGSDQNESLVEYTRLNVQRMSRIDKTLKLEDSALSTLDHVGDHVVFLTITEGWCGDAAQIVPVIEQVAENLGVEARYLLRDENLELMDLHLTHGARSIPILLVLEKKSYQVIAKYGPRPSQLQRMVSDYKALEEPKLPYDEFVKSVQLWYAKDRQVTIQQEIAETLSQALQPDA